MRVLLVIVAITVFILVVYSCLFTVDKTEYVYLTQFGRHVATYDGNRSASDAGLHLKWPWPIQSVQRLDRRLQYFDLPATELLTRDEGGKTIEKTLTGEVFICWRILDKENVDVFVRRMGKVEDARSILRERIIGLLGAQIGKMSMAELINADPAASNRVHATMAGLRQNLLKEMDTVPQDYGIEIVDIQIRRLNHPATVRGDIAQRIKSERARIVARHENEGKEEASKIERDAEREASKIVAEAEAEKRRRIGRAEAEADKIRNAAQSKDPQFYEFLKKLESYKEMFGDGKTALLLSTHQKMLDALLESSPRENPAPPVKPESANPSPPSKSGGG